MLPLDVQAANVAGDGRSLPSPLALHPVRPAAAAVTAAGNLLAWAHRPLIIAGRGAVLADAREPLERLAEQIGALLATSANGNGLFSGNPWSLGISGGFASPAALELIPHHLHGRVHQLRPSLPDGRKVETATADHTRHRLVPENGAHGAGSLGTVGSACDGLHRAWTEHHPLEQ